MATDAEILDAYESAYIHAKIVARGRLDDDTCLSEAGLAVTIALQRHDPELASLKTYSCRRVGWQVLSILQKHARRKRLGEL